MSVIRDDGRCDTEIRRLIGIARMPLRNRKILINRKILMETNINIQLLFNTNPSECWRISSQMKWRLAVLQKNAEDSLDITCEELGSFNENGTKRTFRLKSERQLKFLEHEKRRLVNLALTGRGKREHLMNLCEWMVEPEHWDCKG